MNNYCVYKHTSPSGKVYIGITINPKQRWRKGSGYSRNEYFYRAIKKYGWDNFTHEIIIKEVDKNFACEFERILIWKYRSNDKRFGYNITSGGEHYTHSEESKDKMRTVSMSVHTRELRRIHHQGGAKPKRVICTDTGTIYQSINDASVRTGINKKGISGCCRGIKHYNTAGGLHWRFYE